MMSRSSSHGYVLCSWWLLCVLDADARGGLAGGLDTMGSHGLVIDECRLWAGRISAGTYLFCQSST